MTQRDVELLLGLNWVLEMDDPSHLRNSVGEVRELVRVCDDGSLDVFRIETCHAYTHPVTFLG